MLSAKTSKGSLKLPLLILSGEENDRMSRESTMTTKLKTILVIRVWRRYFPHQHSQGYWGNFKFNKFWTVCEI